MYIILNCVFLRITCSSYVSNPFLMNCRAYANYMQINYTCVPGTSMISEFVI